LSVVVFTQYLVGNKPAGPFTWIGGIIALTAYAYAGLNIQRFRKTNLNLSEACIILLISL